jgi:hypothetical protein
MNASEWTLWNDEDNLYIELIGVGGYEKYTRCSIRASGQANHSSRSMIDNGLKSQAQELLLLKLYRVLRESLSALLPD